MYFLSLFSEHAGQCVLGTGEDRGVLAEIAGQLDC